MVFKSATTVKKITKEIKRRVSKNDSLLQLDIIYIGDNDASDIFINEKRKYGESIGVTVKIHHLKDTNSATDIKNLFTRLNTDPTCTGYLVQLPVKKKYLEHDMLDWISVKKDVDCLTSYNLGYAIKGKENALQPATVSAILTMLNSLKPSLASKKITIINDSNLIGKPLAAQLLQQKATVTICNKYTKELDRFTQHADVIITAAGVPGLITADMVQEESTVIDAGTTFKNGKIIGDVDSESLQAKVQTITPVPGGVGPLTVAILFQNLLTLYESQKQGSSNF